MEKDSCLVDKKLPKEEATTKSSPPKMGPMKTFFAIVKAYCAINVLLLPYSFAQGGYILSPCAMALSLFFEALCAARLCKVAQQLDIYSYPLIMERAMGKKGLIISRLVLALSHF